MINKKQHLGNGLMAVLFVFLSVKSEQLPAQPRRFLLPKSLSEVSGLCIINKDSLWWHNDSGNGAELILTNDKGKLEEIIPIQGINNEDWEDLTKDDQGRLYIGDFGNNANRRQNLRIFIYNPATAAVDSILFRYPDQNAFPPPPQQANFDMEGFFYYSDSLHLFSKNRIHSGNYYTKHYTIPAKPGTYTAILQDSLQLPKRVVTGAAISPDRQEVALLSYYYKLILGFIPKTRTSVFFFKDFQGSRFLLGSMRKQRIPHRHLPSQFEAIDFAPDGSLILASEQTPLFRAQAYRPKAQKNRNKV